MPSLPFKQVDVFCYRPLQGNPLAVIALDHEPEAAWMQAVAAWTNLSETAFLLPPTTTEASYRVRIFTPRRELPFAGHPSVGAAHAALEFARVSAESGRLIQECGAGLLPLTVEPGPDGPIISVRAPTARIQPESWLESQSESQSKPDQPGIADAALRSLLDAALAGLPLAALGPCRIDNGPIWWTVEIADAHALRRHRPDLAAIARLTEATGTVGLAAFADARDDDCDRVVRAWCPADGIPEDPVTGSVNACIGARLLDAGRIGIGNRYIASQGREVGRDGRVIVTAASDGIWVGGGAVTVIDGSLRPR
ncbi:MAG TPA: phenazine biosynthesis protein [Xanthomonadales bacterium]|nr:phenazine biosynthesis protein [Xanthomonadales bacterium]